MSNYLNTQVQHIIGSENDPHNEVTGMASGRNFHLNTGHGDSGVYTMARHQRPVEQKTELARLPPRAGIFFKLMQVTQPNVEKADLAIDEEEFNYLCQLRRRIARQLNEFYPFASLESFLQLGEENRPKTERSERRRKRPSLHAAPQRQKKMSKSLPNITGALKQNAAAGPKRSAIKGGGDDVSGDEGVQTERAQTNSRVGYRRTHVAFSMPAD